MSGGKARDGREGLTYAAPHLGLFHGAVAGDTVKLSNRKPPFLVVYFAPHAPPITQWGGRLWRCEIIDAVSTEEEFQRNGFARPEESHRKFARAAEIRLIEDLPLTTLLGAHGARLAAVIDKAHTLTAAEAGRLAQARGANAVDVRARVFARWMAGRAMPQNRLVDGHGSLLSIGIEEDAPARPAMTLVEHGATQSARAALNDDALLLVNFGDADAGEEDTLLQPWASAAGALADAAMALGAPEIVTAEERAELLAGWIDAFGAEPA